MDRRVAPTAKRIIFLNRFFFPDRSATSQILGDLAFHLASCGHDVGVVTSQQRYEDAAARLPQTEVVDGVAIHRLSGTRFGRAALLGRGLDDLSFHAGAWRSLLALAHPGDILVAKTDPPLACVPAMQAARRRGLQLVNWMQDLYPEVAIGLGVPWLDGPVGHALSRLRDAALRAAAVNVVVGAGMADNVAARGIAAERIRVIANWCDDQDIVPIPHSDNPLRRAWGLEDRFVVGYSGNLGRAHEFDTVLAAAERLRDDPRTIFLCIGGGQKREALMGGVKARRLERSFRFMPYQDRRQLRYSLGAADVHWISLKPELEGLVLPSKIYGIAAAGRPMIAITAIDGEIARLVRQHDCGLVVEPGDAASLVAALACLSADSARRDAMGRRARAMLDTHFTRGLAFARWREVLQGIG
jgi:glycosyltransferase involved in cell wall biosynthesis